MMTSIFDDYDEENKKELSINEKRMKILCYLAENNKSDDWRLKEFYNNYIKDDSYKDFVDSIFITYNDEEGFNYLDHLYKIYSNTYSNRFAIMLMNDIKIHGFHRLFAPASWIYFIVRQYKIYKMYMECEEERKSQYINLIHNLYILDHFGDNAYHFVSSDCDILEDLLSVPMIKYILEKDDMSPSELEFISNLFKLKDARLRRANANKSDIIIELFIDEFISISEDPEIIKMRQWKDISSSLQI